MFVIPILLLKIQIEMSIHYNNEVKKLISALTSLKITNTGVAASKAL